MKTISLDRAKEISSNWHGGQFSWLYQFASSGIFQLTDYLYYLKEVEACLQPEYFAAHPYELKKKDIAELNSLKRYFIAEAAQWGVITGYGIHPTYGYNVPFFKSANGNNIRPLQLAV